MSNTFTIRTDGASRGNPGHASYAYTIDISNPSNRPLKHFPIEASGYLGKVTNNFAEYSAIILALRRVANVIFGSKEPVMDSEEIEPKVILYSDSEFIINQLRGENQVKSSNLIPLYQEASKLAKIIGNVEFIWVRREQNSVTDALCNKILNGPLPPVTDPLAGAIWS